MFILQDVVAVIFVLGVMILIHELGHFAAAKYFDVKVDAFAFGFGPRLFGKKWGETDYRVCALPLGGYVKMSGEQPGDDHTSDPREFSAKPRWQRLIIAVMGPAMNVVLAVALLVGLYMVRYERLAFLDQTPVLSDVEPNSPADKAGLKEGDKIVSIDDKQSPNWEDVTLRAVAAAGQPMHLRIERGGRQLDVTVTPTSDPSTGIGYTGWSEQVPVQLGEIVAGMPAAQAGLKTGDVLVSVNGQPIRSRRKLPQVLQEKGGQAVVIVYLRNGVEHSATVTPVFHAESKDEGAAWRIGVGLMPKYVKVVTRLSFPAALRESIDWNRKNTSLIFEFLRGIVQRRMSPKSLEGPIGIARLSGDAARHGFTDLIMVMSAISLNLGIFNLLPIPILDGGVIILLLFESLIGRDINLAVKERIVQAGFVFLMLLFVFVIYNDIVKSLARG
ncbi:MAG TPA: RIP metalloprotease RseP [Bryobacterales bacterium]|nr:RIP metalloprotease RseP [Bryobacterales bacterium]